MVLFVLGWTPSNRLFSLIVKSFKSPDLNGCKNRSSERCVSALWAGIRWTSLHWVPIELICYLLFFSMPASLFILETRAFWRRGFSHVMYIQMFELWLNVWQFAANDVVYKPGVYSVFVVAIYLSNIFIFLLLWNAHRLSYPPINCISFHCITSIQFYCL